MIARTYPGADIPELTDSHIKDILDAKFNEAMICAGGHAFTMDGHWKSHILPLLMEKPFGQRTTNGNIASRGIITYCTTFGSLENMSPQALYLENVVNWAVLHSSLVLTTFLCVVESASLYSAVLVVVVVLEARNELAGSYIEDLAIIIRGIVPTILVSHVVAGHARPDDSWSDNTTASSVRFRNHSSSQNDSHLSVESGWDTSPHIGPDVEEGLEIIVSYEATLYFHLIIIQLWITNGLLNTT
ncbi:hypothetical protein ARMGADRAFT_1032503 [Armillaria gallica]|uniref:Uncharacterized protein n=1 Tax=Armillaria gallica TaxID=47427 RepID=A0A2H3DST5_ARMGA|nr:hypothetical protein ARMGADRAFT_1032503 [Armillaria gallica]